MAYDQITAHRKWAAASQHEVIVMTAIQDPRPQHRSGAGARSREALTAALRALRHVQDEQMRMWEAFYRISTWDTRPHAPAPGHARSAPGSDSRPPADASGTRAA